MAMKTIMIPASALVPDQDAQLVAGDAAAGWASHKGRPVLTFDDTDEEAATSPEYPVDGWAGGTLKAEIAIASDSDSTNGCVFDVAVECVTVGDAVDLETLEGFDTVNSSGDIDLSGAAAAGELITATITLSNDDSITDGDTIRVGIRRDTDNGNDDASGDMYLYWIRLYED